MDNQIILQDLQNHITINLGGITEKIILFGSRNNGNSKIDSDYDILIVLNRDYDWILERQIYDLCYDIDLKYDILIDAKIISRNELSTIRGKQPFIQNALETGMLV